MMEILNRFTGKIIFKSRHKTKRATVIAAIKRGADLQGADLWRADLWRADLCDCYFNKTKISYRGKVVEVNFVKSEASND